MFTQYTDALALMRGFAAHNRSFVTKVLESKHDVYGVLRQTANGEDYL